MLIGEVAERSGVSARMLRHYDRIGLVRPSERSAGGYRQYSDADIQRLFQVEALRSLGLSLREVADVLGDLSFSPADLVDTLIIRARERLARQKSLLRDLSRVKASEPGEWFDVLRTIGLIRGLGAEDPSIRQRIALSLDPRERDIRTIVEAALNETDPNAAGAFDWILAQDGEAAVSLLADALDARVESRRHRAVEALVKVGTPSAAEALADAFQHTDPFVRARAVLARGALGEADVIPALISLIVEGRDDVDAAQVLAGLAAKHGRAEEITETVAAELDDVSHPARLRLISALAEVPGEAVDALFTSLLDDPDRHIALAAAYLLNSRHPGEHPAHNL